MTVRSSATLLQVLPRLPTLLRNMRPTWHLTSLAELDERFLKANGIRGLIWDVDGTLTGDREAELSTRSRDAFQALTAMPGVGHVVLSNAGETRFIQLGDIMPSAILCRGYWVSGQVVFRKRVGMRDDWSADDLEKELAQGAVVIRKPSAELIEFALQQLGTSKQETVMVGDQYLTDVAGANLAGIRSIKLPTIEPGTFRWSVRLSQIVEAMAYRVLYGRAA